MGQCCSKKEQQNAIKQNKNIDDKRMFKLGVEILNKDFNVQIGYNRKAIETYSKPPDKQSSEVEQEEEAVVS